MPVVVASQSVADGATLTSTAFAYSPEKEVTTSCLNPTPAPTQVCQVRLELSNDSGSTFTSKRIKWFGTKPAVTYLEAFDLGEFAQQDAWTHYRLVFYGHVGAAVTVAADEPAGTAQAVVTLTGLNSTGTAALGVWTPGWAGATLIDSVRILATNSSTGAANLFAGAANSAIINSASMINGAQLNAAANTIILSGANNSVASAILNANGSITFTANADTTGFAGKAFITYSKP